MCPSAQNGAVSIVVRLGPLPLLQRRAGRLVELERIFGEPVDLTEVATVAELARAVRETEVVAVVFDAPAPGDLAEAVEAAGARPVLRPLWRRVRNNRGETDEIFDGYGRLMEEGVVERLADRALSRP